MILIKNKINQIDINKGEELIHLLLSKINLKNIMNKMHQNHLLRMMIIKDLKVVKINTLKKVNIVIISPKSTIVQQLLTNMKLKSQRMNHHHFIRQKIKI